MIAFYIIVICFHKIFAKLSEIDRIEFCKTLHCDETVDKKVCGMRRENGRNFYKIFENECLLMKYGCQVDDDDAYGIINTQACYEHISQDNYNNSCPNCKLLKKEPVCGLRKDGDGFRVRIFENKCQLEKYNCQENFKFNITNFFICAYNNDNLRMNEINETAAIDFHEDFKANQIIDEDSKDVISNLTTELEAVVKNTTNLPNEGILTVEPEYNNKVMKKIVVVNTAMSDLININNTVDDFFAATHVFDLPVQEMEPNINESTRRRLVEVFGPTKVFKPWVQIPKNISEGHNYKPTLSSCFHKCPTKCPDTYAPVCGVPGVRAREPSLMFQNHCFMDVAQCKMFWENKSETSESSAYIEASFVFCLGEELNGLYRFLPLIKTLQHMGRLKKKGTFKYKLTNMRFFNQLMKRQPRLMG